MYNLFWNFSRSSCSLSNEKVDHEPVTDATSWVTESLFVKVEIVNVS